VLEKIFYFQEFVIFGLISVAIFALMSLGRMVLAFVNTMDL